MSSTSSYPFKLVLKLNCIKIVWKFKCWLKHVIFLFLSFAHCILKLCRSKNTFVNEGEAFLKDGLKYALDFVLRGCHCWTHYNIVLKLSIIISQQNPILKLIFNRLRKLYYLDKPWSKKSLENNSFFSWKCGKNRILNRYNLY